jgi:hypothetical protein
MASDRPMAHIDESGRARGAAALAAGIEKLGAGIHSFGASMESADDARTAALSQLEIAKANSQWSIAKLDTTAGIKGPGGSTGAGSTGGGYAAPGAAAPADADPFNPADPSDDTPDVGPQAAVAPQAGAAPQVGQAPYAVTPDNAGAQPAQSVTGNQAYDAQLADAIKKRDESAANITDPRKRLLWKLQTDDDIARIRIAGQKAARAADRDRHLTYMRDAQDRVISQSLVIDDEKFKADAIDGQMDIINGAAAAGYMTQQQAFAWKHAFRNKYLKTDALSIRGQGAGSGQQDDFRTGAGAAECGHGAAEATGPASRADQDSRQVL